MTNDAHLTAEQIARYQARTLAAAELLAVDRHLAICGECRGAIYRKIGAQAQLEGLRSRFSEHLTYDQVAACAQGTGDVAAETHLKECAACRDEVEDLRVFAQPTAPVDISRKRAKWVVPAWIAAAAAVVVLIGSILRTDRPSPIPAAPVAQQQPVRPAEPVLTAEQRDALTAVVSTHKFERAPVLDRLVSRRGVLLGGGSESKTFDLSAPIGTSVTTDRPTFRWQALPGATRYVVSVFDETFHRVAESPAVGATEWQSADSLPRGRIYIWQVTATVADEAVRAPVPPAPEARFQIAGPEVTTAIEEARRSHPGNHLLLAALLARNGALDEAAVELDQLAATDPATAQSLRDSLTQIRRR